MDIAELSFYVFPMLFGAGFLAGFVDSVAGGGGLIALPALLFIGLPPQMALGTNKLQGSFGTLSASYNYIKNGNASIKDSFSGIIFTFIGAASGSVLVQLVNASIIEKIIPVLLFLVFVYTFFSKDLGFKDQPPKLSNKAFYLLLGLGLGFYDGFFGPGTGSFWTLGFMFFLGFNMTKATGHTKIMNFTSNIASLIFFTLGNNICFSVGLTMAAGQVIGARLGSGMAMKKGAGFIRPVFLSVVFFTILRLIYVNFFKG